MKYAVAMLLIGVAFSALYGCSPQKDLAHRLKGADRVVVTNTFAGPSITITGEEVTKVIQAIASGKKESPAIACSPSLQLHFFKNTEHLGMISTCVQVFWLEQGPYSDTTGTLKAIDQRYRDEHPPRLSP